MLYQNTTQVPNFIFDLYLPELTESELKILLIITRQTLGWKNKTTGDRKVRDRLTRNQFERKTGLSKRVITQAIQGLYKKELIEVSDYPGNRLTTPQERKGKGHLYYSLSKPAHISNLESAKRVSTQVHQSAHNKSNLSLGIVSKLKDVFAGHIKTLLTSRF